MWEANVDGIRHICESATLNAFLIFLLTVFLSLF